ncbi:hypothetical protein MPSEU_001034900 [Mayamaea pseudoterrestris]|nr:hypothetical protein MPSEU_001034900 [Mayamaea pseudoterrestris]
MVTPRKTAASAKQSPKARRVAVDDLPPVVPLTEEQHKIAVRNAQAFTTKKPVNAPTAVAATPFAYKPASAKKSSPAKRRQAAAAATPYVSPLAATPTTRSKALKKTVLSPDTIKPVTTKGASVRKAALAPTTPVVAGQKIVGMASPTVTTHTPLISRHVKFASALVQRNHDEDDDGYETGDSDVQVRAERMASKKKKPGTVAHRKSTLEGVTAADGHVMPLVMAMAFALVASLVTGLLNGSDVHSTATTACVSTFKFAKFLVWDVAIKLVGSFLWSAFARAPLVCIFCGTVSHYVYTRKAKEPHLDEDDEATMSDVERTRSYVYKCLQVKTEQWHMADGIRDGAKKQLYPGDNGAQARFVAGTWKTVCDNIENDDNVAVRTKKLDGHACQIWRWQEAAH